MGGFGPVTRSADAPIRVLLIEDNPGDVRLIEELLAEADDSSFVVEAVERLAEGLDRLEERPYAAVLLDLHLPDAVGLETLLQAHNRASDVPIIVLTGLDDETVGLEAMHQGAQDYLIKSDLTPEILTRSLRYAIGRHRTLQHLRMMSTIDELTGLNNRRGFLTLAEQQIKMADRTGHELLVVFADLDGLKQINDTWGHDEGDHALIDAAELVAGTFRDSDIIGRLGGDEFVVFLADCPRERADALVDRLHRNLAARNAEKGRRFALSISTGMAIYDPTEPCCLEELLRRADAAMYEQKRLRSQGRCVSV
jgi:two-component system cell cycle response regulator